LSMKSLSRLSADTVDTVKEMIVWITNIVTQPW
jgi:hypothetical protein